MTKGVAQKKYALLPADPDYYSFSIMKSLPILKCFDHSLLIL